MRSLKQLLIDAAVFSAVIISVVSCTGCNGGGAPRDIVTSENTEADLGTIREADGPVQVNLLVPNTSSDTLIPLAAYTRCQCLSASVVRRAVAPGENLCIETIYNPSYKKGIFMEEIYVRLSGDNSLSLIVKGEVIPMEHPIEEDHPYDFGSGLHLSHEVLHYGNMDAGEQKDIFIRYANSRNSCVRLEFEVDPRLKGNLDFRNGVEVKSGGRDTLNFRFTMFRDVPPGDTLEMPVYPLLNGKRVAKPLIIKAIGRINDK